VFDIVHVSKSRLVQSTNPRSSDDLMDAVMLIIPRWLTSCMLISARVVMFNVFQMSVTWPLIDLVMIKQLGQWLGMAASCPDSAWSQHHSADWYCDVNLYFYFRFYEKNVGCIVPDL
jgi:hypothetical protein